MSSLRVDFYVLGNGVETMSFLCRITDKIWRQGHSIYIHADSEHTAIQIDDLLWTYQDIGFLPHTLGDPNTTQPIPISIGWPEIAYTQQDVMINLATQVPEFVPAFQRVIEFAPQDDTKKQAARLRFLSYREQGFERYHHTIEAS